MVAAALADGTADRDCVFEVFARRLPHGRRFGVLAGTGRLLEQLPAFRFGDEEIASLREQGVTDERLLDWLAAYRFSGDIEGYAEGDLYFPGSPVLTVRAPFAEGVLLETLALSILNHDSAIASAAARMVAAACERPCIEMGSRRTHEQAAVAAARAAHLVGFASTSNLEAGRTLRRPDDRHQRARLHAAARRREGGLPGAGRRPRPGDDAARRHLRRRPGHPDGGRGRRARARRHPAGLRRPAHPRHPRARAARLPRRDEDADRRHQRPRRVRDRRPDGRPGRPLRRRHVAGHRLGGARRPAWSTSSSSATACRWPRSRRASARWAAASTPSGGTTTTGRRWPRWSAARRSRPATATATSSSPWWRRASVCSPASPAEALREARAHHERARAALPPEAWALSRGEPALDTVTA